jgi:hypothetical protein
MSTRKEEPTYVNEVDYGDEDNEDADNSHPFYNDDD